MADSRRRKQGPVTARPRIEKAEVSSPYTQGKIDVVERVTDTLTTMLNRKQISQLQFSAGDRLRLACEMTSASMGGTMDFDRVRGGSGGAPTPALAYLDAAEIVSQARKYLYPRDYAMVYRVALQGFSIEQAARQLYNEEYDGKWPAYLTEAGRRFRTGLDELADRWWPDSKQRKDPKTGDEIRPMQGFRNEKATSTDADSVPQSSRVAHATRDKVYRSNDRRMEKA